VKFRNNTILFITVCLLFSGTSAIAAGQLAPRNVYIHDENGDPITGGSVTWSMKDKSARSAKTYGLTSDGLITFPYAPLGEATVKITNGLMASGDYVSGSYGVTLSNDNEIQIALAPKHTHTVHVEGPDGDGIAGAVVTLNTSCQTQIWNDEMTWVDGYYDASDNWVDGYYEGGYELGDGSTSLTASQNNQYGDYTAPNVTESTYADSSEDDVYIATTDSSGVATFNGYFEKSDCLDVTASYNDGIVIQNASGILDAGTPVVLPYVPIITVSSDTVTVKEGTAVQIPISVGISGQSNIRQSLQRSNVVSAPGATVKIALPPGASKGNCGARLSGQTDLKGHVTLKICATKSGEYRIVAKGILRDTGVEVHVRGAAPLVVSSVSASSPAVGVLKASWNAPLYSGGVAVNGYDVIVTGPNGRSSKLSLNPASKSVRITGLAHAAKYTIKILAKTKFGTSDPIVRTVTVA